MKKTTITFSNISKQYQLGLTRTSAPALAARWARKALRRPAGEAAERTFWALREVSFELRQGDSLALVGANGAGKTTILKLLANITKPTSGSLATHGQLSALIELGTGFHPDLTGRENIFLNGTILGLRRKEIAGRLDEIIDFAELERFIDTPVKRYSSGMIVRLGFAVAASINPDILLVDEVLAVGDAAFQQKCLKRIHSLIEGGTSIVFVSHNFYLVQAVCSTALYLKKGQVQRYGPTRQVIDHYEQDLHQERAAKFQRTAQVAEGQSDDIEITKVEVLDATGEQPESFASSQAAQVRIHYNAYRPLGKVQASVFLIRSDGQTCCMVRTRLDQFDLVVEKGQGVVSLLMQPLQLVTGSYFVEAWFLNEADSLAILPNPGRSDWFSVKGAGLSYEESSGIFEPISQWDHQPASGFAAAPASLSAPAFSSNGANHRHQSQP